MGKTAFQVSANSTEAKRGEWAQSSGIEVGGLHHLNTTIADL